MIRFDRARRTYPILNSEFGYEFGVDKLPTHTHGNQCDWREFVRRAYQIYFAGGYGVYYYNNTAWDVIKPDPEPPGMKAWQTLKQSLSALPWWRMQPADELAVGASCLALPGEAYAFYVEGAKVTINLTGLEHGAITAKWVNTWTGEEKKPSNIRPEIRKLGKPEGFGEAPALLIVRPARISNVKRLSPISVCLWWRQSAVRGQQSIFRRLNPKAGGANSMLPRTLNASLAWPPPNSMTSSAGSLLRTIGHLLP